MKSVFIFSILSFLFYLVGCGGSVATSLLTNSTSTCDPITNPSCTDLTGGTGGAGSTSALEITPSSLNLIANMDKSDTVEITGTCNDKGIRKNRILVEVFAGDINESVDPYINNDKSSQCINLAGAGLTSSGIPYGSNCFWVTKGIGLVEDLGLPSQRDYPQCHDGQFGFTVRLGKVLTDPALGLNYLVRLKLRTEDGGVSESVLSRVVVARQIGSPSIDSRTIDPTLFKCSLKNSVARFNQNISYVLNRSYKIISTGAESATAPATGYNPLTSASSIAYNFDDLQLVDGVTYSYSITGTDTEYAYLAPVPVGISNTMQCPMPNPTLIQFRAPLANRCSFNVQYSNVSTNVKYQIAYGPPNWTGTPGSGANNPPVPRVCDPGTSLNSATYYCDVSGLSAGTRYNFATRAYKDTNNNNFPDATEEVGYWSNESVCQTP